MTHLPFHLSLTAHSLDAARLFYGAVLGCREGASAPTWVDFDFFGHQLSLHLGPVASFDAYSQIDGNDMPLPHFGVVLGAEAWHALIKRVRSAAVHFVLAPHVRYAGETREQSTFVVRDLSGNALEFKSMRDPAMLFAQGVA